MLATVAEWLFGCSHRRTSFPITHRRTVRVEGRNVLQAETHIVCLECGRSFAYDWTTMRIAQPAASAEDPRVQKGFGTGTAFPAANRFFQRLVHHT
jgi:hypothetical protein